MIIRLSNVRLLRYLLASVGALAVDVGCYVALLSLAVWPVWAAAASYGVGILAHWLMSSRAVFTDSVAERGLARTRQKALFVASAMAGLALTTVVVWGGDAAGFHPLISKLFAIAISFTATYLLRAKIVFHSGV